LGVDSERTGQTDELAVTPPVEIPFRDRRRTNVSRGDWDSVEHAKKEISTVRKNRGATAVEKDEKVLGIVLASLKKRGEFFHDTVRSYLFLNAKRVVLPIDITEEGLELALYDYGLLPNENITKQVIHALRLHARKEGQEV